MTFFLLHNCQDILVDKIACNLDVAIYNDLGLHCKRG